MKGSHKTMKVNTIFPVFPFTALMGVSTCLQLNVTAISARDGSSTLECWQVGQPFTRLGAPGRVDAMLGGVSTISYGIRPANHDAGIHNAPGNEWVVVIGLAYFTLPGDNVTGAYVSSGRSSLIFAADTADVSRTGHRTQYPGDIETIVLHIPTHDGKVPDHSFLHMGPCGIDDLVGIREFGQGADPDQHMFEARDGTAWPFQLW
ncbi:hypothetical protein GGR53DRAFT_498620 [Hypoxylon sp. FL1150]|nr:hypothetical protein GGR53DRAFT_498620 [Hypoxylon sp. FL1150]